ncbi:MAG: hypothetical protein LC131_00180 [Anaerolineae bacterium]|nr:hypothetical protein [Anaerolineae bacterium]
MPKVRHVQVTYELSKAEIEELIRQHFQAIPLTPVTWDIAGSGKVRSASITVSQTELVEPMAHETRHISMD